MKEKELLELLNLIEYHSRLDLTQKSQDHDLILINKLVRKALDLIKNSKEIL